MREAVLRVDEQITCVLKRHGSGVSADEIFRETGVSSASFYKWKKKFSGMGISELRQLKSLEDENRRLKKLVADLSLDKHRLQEAFSKKF